MHNDNMFFSNFGPNNQMMPSPGPVPNFTPDFGMMGNIEDRLNKIEKNLKRLEQRITRLESPYSINDNYDDDGNMYMI